MRVEGPHPIVAVLGAINVDLVVSGAPLPGPGETVTGAQGLSLANVPAGTFAIYLYWGASRWPFDRVYVDAGQKTVTDGNEWYFYGAQTLRAVALNW